MTCTVNTADRKEIYKLQYRWFLIWFTVKTTDSKAQINIEYRRMVDQVSYGEQQFLDDIKKRF